MNELIEFINQNRELKNNPKKIATMITELAEQIEKVENDVSEIRDRGIFKKAIANNTRDLANAILKQNDTITSFLNIVQGLIMMNMNNLIILSEIQKEIKYQEEERGMFENEYLQTAKEYISESYKATLALNNKIDRVNSSLGLVDKKFIYIAIAYGVLNFIAVLFLLFKV